MASDMPQRRPWTLMIYMAGDNGKVFDSEYGKLKLMDPMTAAGKSDLAEMGAIGTTDHAAVTCLFDTDQGVTYLVEVPAQRTRPGRQQLPPLAGRQHGRSEYPPAVHRRKRTPSPPITTGW